MEISQTEDDLLQKFPLSRVKSLCNKDPTILHKLNDVAVHFREKLKDNLSNIPCINEVPLENIAPNSLIRFRGMIQDMLDPEYYLGRFPVVNKITKEKQTRFGCYTDICEKRDEEIDFENEANVTLERQTYYCVPVPGENQWLKDTFLANSSSATLSKLSKPPISQNKKRVLDDHKNGTIDNDESMVVDNCSPSGEKKSKLDVEMSVTSAGENSTKKKEKKFEKNHPLPNEDGITCFVSMYSNIDELKLNEVLDFVCVYSVDPVSATNTMNANSADDQVSACSLEDNTLQIPSHVPRIHCIFFNKLTSLNPSINMKTSLYQNTLQELSSIRKDLIQLLTKMFGGDAAVAEYFLLHMISSTYGRCGTMCIGKLSLNITNCNTKLSQQIYDLMKILLEKSFYLPLTVENLNKLKFTPKKDYDANRLLSGILQLSADTNLVLDETAMEPGKLDSDGIKNIQAIGNLIQWQNVEYDFKFNKVEMKTNVNVLVISEAKSILKCDCRIPIVSDEINSEQTDVLISNLNSALLEKARIYLLAVRLLDYNLSEEVSKALEEDFVEMRKEDPKATNADTFYNLLSVARYMALSYGQSTLSASLWIRAKDLDAERRKRIL